jgi:hypothetical protein
MVGKKDGSPGKASAGGMTKREAVRRGLGLLGDAATTGRLQKHIKDSYGIDMSRKHISVERSKILRASGGQGPAAPKPAAVGEEPEGGGSKAFGLEDIEAVKELVERLGASSLKKLIDVMAR